MEIKTFGHLNKRLYTIQYADSEIEAEVVRSVHTERIELFIKNNQKERITRQDRLLRDYGHYSKLPVPYINQPSPAELFLKYYYDTPEMMAAILEQGQVDKDTFDKVLRRNKLGQIALGMSEYLERYEIVNDFSCSIENWLDMDTAELSKSLSS